MEQTDARILAEVKSGNFTINDVRAFCHTMDSVNAIAGIFITLTPVTTGMMQIAANMGTFEHNNTTYPRLRFWQIDDNYFQNPNQVSSLIRLPAEWLRPVAKSDASRT